MVFNVGKIRSTIQQLGQKLTPQNIQQFGTKVRDTALQVGRKVSNTLGKVGDIGNKLLPMADTTDMVSNAKKTVDTLRNQGLAFTKGGIPPAQIKPKYDYSDVYNLNSLFKGN